MGGLIGHAAPGHDRNDLSVAIDLTPWTYVDRFKVLHAADDLPVGAKITVTAHTAYSNPSGSTPAIADKTLVITVAA